MRGGDTNSAVAWVERSETQGKRARTIGFDALKPSYKAATAAHGDE